MTDDELAKKPLIAVLLPLYNAAASIILALESLQSQTYPHWHAFVVNDASTDESAQVVKDWVRQTGETRLTLIEQPQNGGVALATNRALEVALEQGFTLLARMDADDQCHPERFTRQVAFLQANPAVGVLGTYLYTFHAEAGVDLIALARGMKQAELEKTVLPLLTQPNQLKAHLLFDCPVGHPTVMLRTTVIKALQEATNHAPLYNPTTSCEDYELWGRLCQHTQLANLPEPLLYYRQHPGQLSHNKPAILQASKAVRQTLLQQWLPSTVVLDLEAHEWLCNPKAQALTLSEVTRCLEWAKTLLQELPTWMGLPEVLSQRLFGLCHTQKSLGLGLWTLWQQWPHRAFIEKKRQNKLHGTLWRYSVKKRVLNGWQWLTSLKMGV